VTHNRGDIVWHPSVHKIIGESLYYLVINSYPFYSHLDSNVKELAGILPSSFHGYVTYGYNDLWMRFWGPRELEDTLKEYLTKHFRQTRARTDGIWPDNYKIMVADPIWFAWGHSVLEFDKAAQQQLDRYPPSMLGELQNEWPSQRSPQHLVLGGMPAQEPGAQGSIRFFYLLDIDSAVPDDDLVKGIIDSVEDGPDSDCLVSLARWRSTDTYVVEMVTPHYRDIKPICDAIGGKLKFSIHKTTTLLVADNVGSESDHGDFSAIGVNYIEAILRRIAPGFRRLGTAEKHALVGWFNRWHRYKMMNDTSDAFIDLFFRAMTSLVKGDMEDAIAYIAPKFERSVRAFAKSLVLGMYGHADLHNLPCAAKLPKGKGWDDLGFGELATLLDECCRKTAPAAPATPAAHHTSEAPDAAGVAAAVRSFARIRNIVMHGKIDQIPWDKALELAGVIDVALPAITALVVDEHAT
jgi:hypothetical protein